MPELDGWNVLERIRDMSEVPVLMLTARGDELERVRGLQAGADDYVVEAVRQAGARRARPGARSAAPSRGGAGAGGRYVRRRVPRRSTGRRRGSPSATARCS